MRHARKPDISPADEPGRSADGRAQPLVTRFRRGAARPAATNSPPVDSPPTPAWPAGDFDYSQPAGEHTISYPAIPKEALAAYAHAERPQFAAPPVLQQPPPSAPRYVPPAYAPPAYDPPPPSYDPAPSYGPPADSAYGRPPVPGQPPFPPASPPRGYNRRPLTAPDAFPATPAPADPVYRFDDRTNPGFNPLPVASPYGQPPAPSPLPDPRPLPAPTLRPPGHSRPKPLTRKGPRFRLPRIRNRRTVVVVAVIAALISANVGLLTIRSHRTATTGRLPLAADPVPKASPSAVSLKNNSTRLGLFQGTKADVNSFERWLGRDVKDVVHFSDRDNWQQIANPNLAEWKNTDYRLIYAVPLLPRNAESAKESSMRAGAKGEFDDYFTTLAENLIADGQENAVLRVGWEFNLKSWPWGISDHEVFKRYFRHVVTAMRAVPGAKFKIDWNVNNAFNPYDGTKYYPGNKYVDYVGVDAYDLDSSVYPYPKQCDDTCRLETQTKAWDEVIFGGERGLDFWSLFAAKHKKPLALPEYGLWDMPDGSGGGDNPYFIEQMHDFITWAPNNVAYAAYFDVDGKDGEHSLRDAFPVAGKHYLKWFGAKKKQ